MLSSQQTLLQRENVSQHGSSFQASAFGIIPQKLTIRRNLQNILQSYNSKKSDLFIGLSVLQQVIYRES